jgi:hypothetical protein
MTAAAIHTVVTDASSSGAGIHTSTSAELVSHQNTDIDIHIHTDRKDPVKRAIVFAPPSSSPQNVGTHHMETNNNNCRENDDDDDSDNNSHQEPFLVSVLFGQQTVGVDNLGNNVDRDDDTVHRDEFGDMVRSWLVTMACCLIFGLVLMAAAAMANTSTHVNVEMSGHQHRGQTLALAALFFQKHKEEDWTGGFSVVHS